MATGTIKKPMETVKEFSFPATNMPQNAWTVVKTGHGITPTDVKFMRCMVIDTENGYYYSNFPIYISNTQIGLFNDLNGALYNMTGTIYVVMK